MKAKRQIESTLNSVTMLDGSGGHVNTHDDLLTVTQSGQSRTFVYTSLSRLSCAANPETTGTCSAPTGGTRYAYDPNGNLLQKTDARGIVTSFGYDALNRLGSKTYSDGSTAQVTYCYGDGVPLPPGVSAFWSCSSAPSVAFSKQRLTLVIGDQSQTEYTQYDEFGRIRALTQTTNGTPYAFSNYNYIVFGAQVSGVTYPSGRALTFSYDQSGRPSGVSGVLASTSTTYATVPSTPSSASSTGFWPSGSIKLLNYAGTSNTFYASSTYDTRLRPLSLGLTTPSASDTFGYTWLANGNLQQETIANSQNAGLLTQNFSYDTLNRQSSATEINGNSVTQWSQNYCYDAFGNRSLVAGGFTPFSGVTPQVTNCSSTPPFGNNQYTGAGYDSAGNVISGAVTVASPDNGTYDAENRLTNVTGSPDFGVRYYYDGSGRRSMKVICSSSPCTNTTSGAQITAFVYDAQGQVAAEYGGSSTVSGTQYLFTDHLGNTRALLGNTGAFTRCYDYAPFGENLTTGIGSRGNCYTDMTPPSPTPGAISLEFTSKERDSRPGWIILVLGTCRAPRDGLPVSILRSRVRSLSFRRPGIATATFTTILSA
jgi:YD repeat-containing protein